MHHLATNNSNFVETGTKNVGSKGSDPPLCPKPRRVGSALPWELLGHSILCNNHQKTCSQMNSDGRNEILNRIADKRMDGADQLCGCSKCLSTSYEWCGSPPRRTENPLVHDVHFLRIHGHMDVLPPHTPT